MTVRVRFAPSPTGYLHVGGLRTALYNFLFARKLNGQFILRIEDTDRKRYVEGAVENLIEGLRWAGMDFDEGPDKGGKAGPYFQSQRLELYQQHVQQLLDQGNAYYAFDTPEELDIMRKAQEKRGASSPKYDRRFMKNSLSRSAEEVQQWIDEGVPYVVRMKVPDDRTSFVFQDIVRGRVEFGTDNVDDQVLMKADGFPTYHLAAVVDDHYMGITHIIRGEEWLSSVPKHLLLYEFFGWEHPQMVHLPLLLDKKGRKISKRNHDKQDPWAVPASVGDYRDAGYERQAFVNFLAMLGWNSGTEQEIFSLDELIDTFTLERINNSGAVFDIDKLNWFNKQYLRHTPLDVIAEEARPAIEAAGYSIPSDAFLLKVTELLQERIAFAHDIAEQGSFFFTAPTEFDAKTLKKRWKADTPELMRGLADRFEALEEFAHDALEAALKGFLEEQGVGMGKVMAPARLAISGQGGGPAFYDMLELLGKEIVVNRLRHAADTLGQ